MMDIFLRHFTEKGRVEQTWLRELFFTVRDKLFPVLTGDSTGLSVDKVALTVVSRLQVCFSSDALPLSFRCVCVSELLSRQRTPCFSSLTMSTSQHKELIREAESALPNHRALPRANLLLIGCLSSGVEGWRVSDSSGSVHCEMLYPDPSWINQPMLFPVWNYIPRNAPEKVDQEAGYLELIASPIHLIPDAVTFDPGGLLSEAQGVREASRRLTEKRPGSALVCVNGEVCMVSPLLVIAGKHFFCFSLRERNKTVPILVMDSSYMFWRPCLSVGRRVCVSALRVCSLKGWAGQRVLSVTSQSRLLALSLPDHHNTTATTGETDQSIQLSPQESCADMQTVRVDTHAYGAADVEPSRASVQTDVAQGEESSSGLAAAAAAAAHTTCTVKIKHSKIISYKGVITAVTDQGAGLYVIDEKVGLCLAYQPLRWNSGLRPGAEVELQHVHFLFRPSPHGLPTMLCACLHSSVRVTSFSLVAPAGPTSLSHGALPHFLLEKNLGVSQYLWLHHYSNALQQRLCPRWVCEPRVCVVAARLLEHVCVHEQSREPRDLYREMLQEPHLCPLNEYRVCAVGCGVPSISELCEWLKEECWSSLSFHSLLPPSAASLTRAELNPLLSWSLRTWSLQEQPKLALLVGVLEISAATATLQLRDQTGAVDCVMVQSTGPGGQTAADNTAWLGCLVCVQRCTLVAERFLKTSFPSWKHLKEEKYITNKLCRVYLQVCVSDLHILSPSTAMSLLLAERENEGAREKTTNGKRSSEPGSRGGEGVREKTTAEETPSDPGSSASKGGRGGGGRTSKERAFEGKGNGEIEGERVKDTEEKRSGVGEEGRKRTCKRMREEGDEGSPEREAMEQAETSKGDDGKRWRMGDRDDLESHAQQGMMGSEARVTSDPCVTLVFHMEAKQGVTLRNHQLSSGATPGLSLSFVAKVTCLGRAQRWDRDPRNAPLQQRESDAPYTKLELHFISSAVRWFPLLHPGSVYRLIALHTENVGVLNVKKETVRGGVKNHGNPSLVVQPRWRIHTLEHTPLTTQIGPFETHNIKTVSQILHSSSCPEIVSFYGVISQRIALEEEHGKPPVIQSLIKDKGVCVETDLRFRLTVRDAEASGKSIQVYVDLSHSPFIHGLIAGATVVLHAFQRLLSRKGNVYCRFLPMSCVTVTALGSEDSDLAQHCTSPPMMLLGEWACTEEGQRCMLGQVKGHVTCVLHLKMQWTCSLCGSIYKQGGCSRTFPLCGSSSAVFQAEAKVAVEDGTGEAQVWFSSEMVPALLLLGATEWEGLQWRVRVRGHLRVYARGRDMVSENPEDPLVRYLCVLCSSSSICRELTLTCQLRSQKQEPPQLRKMRRGEREFLSKFLSPLQLTCTHAAPLPHTL